MLRAKCLAVLGALAASATLIPLAPASAKPLPIASPDELESMTRQVDYRQCYWADGYRLCRTFYVDEAGDRASATPDYGHYGAPGIYLGFGNVGGGYRPGGRGILDDGDGR
jgi:hypothetical protein